MSDVHAPIKTQKVRSTYAAWLATDIRHEMNQRDHLKKKAVKNKSKTLFEAYKAKRNRINKIIESAKSNYCKRKLITIKVIQKRCGNRLIRSLVIRVDVQKLRR